MKRSAWACCAMLFSAYSVAAADSPDQYFQQSVAYEIHVRLDTSSHTIAGRETIQYTNNSPDTLDQIYLHLYPNAYRSKESELIKHYRRRYNVTLIDLPKSRRSNLELAEVRVGGRSATPEIDDTIARIPLPDPLPPGGSVELAFDFSGKVRKHAGRAGYRGDHYDFAQWYPKVVVYDQNGFHPDKFKAGEFYGEFGTYDVFIDIPTRFVVAATGVVVDGDPGWTLNSKDGATPPGAGRKTVHFRAENVHDFAWNADPQFVVQDTTWNGVDVYSFYRKRNAKAWEDTTITHAIRALDWLSRIVGPYPYPQVSVVDALLPGGMEYPMLVMDGGAREGLAVHEIGHIYFYGALANDERAAAWLDEGFTTFQTYWYMEERYGRWGNRADWNLYQRITPQYSLWAKVRLGIADLERRGYGERIATRAEDFENSYRQHVYSKAALMLRALRYVVGEATFEAILHEYYDRWKLKHVNEARFRAVCEEVSGMDLSLFFEQWLHTRKICDYRLEKTDTRPSGNSYRCEVEIRRQGEMIMPVELVFELEDGTTQTHRVDGKLRTIHETFDLPAKPRRTSLNPNNEIFDIDMADNFLPRRHDFQLDWPNNRYYPEDAYQIRYRPGLWYNDIDGLKAGLHLNDSYLGRFRRLQLGVYYGFESDRVDFSARYDRPMRLFGNNAWWRVSGFKMEGRRDFTMALTVLRQPRLTRPPRHQLSFGFNYHKLTRPEYLNSPEIYDTSRADVAPYIRYSVDPQFDLFSTNIVADLRLGREWGAGKFKYERFSTTASLGARRSLVPVDFRLRFFLGLMGGTIPLQEKFNLAGAGPLETEKRFYLRSPGAIWEDLNYHEGGDGNLRGYQAGTFGVNRLVALNLETGTSIPLFGLGRLTRPLLGKLSWVGFLDVGWILDKDNPIADSGRVAALTEAGILDQTLFDAGVGLRSRRLFPFYDLRLRLDLPFYVNHPEINGETDKTQLRYLLSLDSAF